MSAGQLSHLIAQRRLRAAWTEEQKEAKRKYDHEAYIKRKKAKKGVVLP